MYLNTILKVKKKTLFMRALFIFSTIVILGSLFSCHPAKIEPKSYTGPQIIFGDGGGFAGSMNEYNLQDNGHLYKRQGVTDEYVWIRRVDLKMTKQIFTNYDQLKLGEVQVNKPGNMYYFIGLQNGADHHRITWSNKDDISAEAKIFFSILMNLIKA